MASLLTTSLIRFFSGSPKIPEAKYKSVITKWGISAALNISTDGYVLADLANSTTNSTEPPQNSSSQTVCYIFDIGEKVHGQLTNGSSYAMDASETVAILLSLQLTDTLARVHVADAQRGFLVLGSFNATVANVTPLHGLGGIATSFNGTQIPLDQVNNAIPAGITFNVGRYGYGYGFRSATTYFGIAVLLGHIVLTIIYIGYALYDFFFVTHWTSSAWGGIGELITLCLDSRPSDEMQNTCVGIGEKETWRKRIFIRETGTTHVGVVVEKGMEGGLGEL
ncbi:hypothetical protein BCR34DRAFT_599529 [Clohesyomyces aquaticus]|uniref:Uncharacterized protein n=1 Tax=Clohesyomyces aquaticus TaxID=1231657 RepID=A0A1Y1ZUI0_9PLEO|nr:hypothetical protein BCR34DRAFT_599529 [Clohesyomyces aquaticus]